MRHLAALVVLAGVTIAAETTAPVTLDRFLGHRAAQALDGREISPTSLRNRVVLVDVWATWCAPCLAELPTLKALRDAHADDLAIVGISADSLTSRELRQWLARRDVTWPQLFDGRGTQGPVLTRLGVNALPRTFLFDRDGRLATSDLRGDRLTRAVEALIADGARR